MAKTNWGMNDTVMPEDMNDIGNEINESLANGSANDNRIGDRTVSDATAPTSNTGKLTSLLNGLAYMIKSITGKSNWRTAPATTLEAAKGHMDDATKHVTSAERTAWNAKANATPATSSASGLMSAADKSKLDGVATGANNYTHPATHPPSIIAQNANNRFMTDAERNKLSGIAAGAQVNTVTSVAGKTGAITLAKGDVGLPNVDNVKQATKVEFDAFKTATMSELADLATIGNYITGFEYMYYAHEKIRTGQGITLVASGDSTTAGVSITDVDFLLHTACKNILNKYGVRHVNAINGGHSSTATPQWQSEFLAEDLATNPDIYILRWGFNDGSWPKETRLQLFINALRGGLATLRAAKSVQELSVVLMMPNSANDDANGRNAEWFEEIYPIIKQAARDFQCCFVDTYHFLMDSTNVAWQDAPMGVPGVHIHPLNTGNAWIASLLADVLIPEALRKTGIVNRLSVEEVKHVANPPSTYPLGVSIYRTQSGGGWPNDGMIITHHSMDGVLYQVNSGLFAQAIEGYSVRRGVSVDSTPFGGIGDDAWAPWIHIRGDGNYQNLTLKNGWQNVGGTAPTAQFMLDAAGNVHVKGAIHSGTVTGGTVIATLPVGYRPSSDTQFPVIANGSFGYIDISWNGDVIARTVNASRTDFGRIVFRAEQ